MRVLIVEDNAFNAFCLRRLLEMTASVSVTIVNNSRDALSLINHYLPDLVILDGDLGKQDKGPQLADYILKEHPQLPLIAWSDSEPMRAQFATVFLKHNRPLDQYNSWPKIINSELISRTWNHYFANYSEIRQQIIHHASSF